MTLESQLVDLDISEQMLVSHFLLLSLLLLLVQIRSLVAVVAVPLLLLLLLLLLSLHFSHWIVLIDVIVVQVVPQDFFAALFFMQKSFMKVRETK